MCYERREQGLHAGALLPRGVLTSGPSTRAREREDRMIMIRDTQNLNTVGTVGVRLPHAGQRRERPGWGTGG